MVVNKPPGKFYPVGDRLAKDGLTLVPLKFLIDDDAEYSLLVLQPKETILATPQAIQCADRATSKSKFSGFIETANKEQPDLVICPEYFGNWDAFIDAVGGNKFPEQGKLWILGMESISTVQIENLAQRCSSAAWVIGEYEEIPQGAFLDVAVFAFWATDDQGQPKKTCLLQFKTQPMVDPKDRFEPTLMHRGKKIYIFSNDANSISLACLLCSDSLTFQYEDLGPGYKNTPYLLIHIQANTDPMHTLYKEYRAHALQYDWSFEIVCVNWAAGFGVDKVCDKSGYGDSCVITKSSDVLLADHVTNANHQQGLYYSYCQPLHAHKYFFNYGEYVFAFATSKVSQRGTPAALHGRTGPKMSRTYDWDKVTGSWKPVQFANDGFAEECAQYVEDISPLTDSTVPPIDKERFLVLSCGKATRTGWHVPKLLYTFGIEVDEKPRRVTACFPKTPEALQKRAQIVQQFCELRNAIIQLPSNLPDVLSDLANDYLLAYSSAPNVQHQNIKRKSGLGAATVAYLGASTDANAQMVFDAMSMLSGKKSNRTVVWYKVGTDLRKKYSSPPVITDSSSDPRNLNKGE